MQTSRALKGVSLRRGKVRTAGRIRSPASVPGFLTLVGLLGCLLAAAAPAQDVIISEFLAIGGDLVDEDGDTPDWLEVYSRDASPVNLGGWYLTDDAADLTKWRFPDTPLNPGEYLVVFASDKDRAEPGEELHTNFRLSGSGEYLALVLPDGQTVVHEYAPAYPEQQEDISFGLPQAGARVPLVSRGTQASYRVPVDGGSPGWYLPAFDDATWETGATGFGFGSGDGGDPPPDGPYNLAPGGQATQSSTFQGGQYPAHLAIDGDLGNFTHTEAGVNLPATWELDLGDSYSLYSVLLYNRSSCCQSRLRDITVTVLDAPAGVVLFESDLLNPENVLGGGGTGGPEVLVVDLVQQTGGPVPGRVVRVVRTPDPDLSGTGGAGNNDEFDVLSLAEVEVVGTEAAYRALISTDVEGAMLGISPSLQLRIPFQVEPGDTFETLRLRLKYEDGFAAYLNGQEVARRNAPATVTWDSTATSERTENEAVVFEEIDVPAPMDVLESGWNLLAIHGLNFTVDDPDFLMLPELLGIREVESAWRYFREPTPGAPNDDDGLVGLVEDTRFSTDRGFYDTPFQVEITTATPDAEIRYTLDGSPPTESGGLTYEGPIWIDQTTTLRARAFKVGLEPTNVDTQTYIFLEDVILQDYQATLAAGFPSSWGGTSPDYGMDTDVIGPGDIFGGVYAATIIDDLRSLPTISIVLRNEDMFGPDGIYTHSTQHGVAWERPASVEFIQPDGSEGFHVNCGIRIQGGWFRQHSGTKKHSFRLLFKDEYGPTKLRWPLYGKRAVEEFDTITLRAGANDGYSWSAARLTEQYTRDEFGRSLQRATGNAGSHGRFVHLYVNGIYWGLYNPVERPDHSFAASYHGGNKEDWDSMHDGAATSGDPGAWDDMLRQCAAARGSLADYLELQGKNLDGTPNPAYPHLLDVPNYIDYLIVNVWGGNWDWPWKNWWAARDRTGNSTGFKFFCWDYENTIGNNRSRSPLTKNALQNNFSSAGQPHVYLRDNPEYRLHFADRVHRLLFNDGILRPESLIPLYDSVATRVERAIVAESARWGDQHHHPPLTLEEWYDERGWILGTYLPRRSDIVLQQLRNAGLYPSLEAPSFQQHGGRVEPGFRLVMTAPVGTIHYTTDGTDPRLPGGAASPTALEAGVDALVIGQTTEVKARALDGDTWSALNEATFVVDTPLRVTEIQYHPADPPDGSPFDADDFEFLELENTGGEALNLDGIRIEGGVQFDFSEGSVSVLQPGAIVVVVKNLEAFSSAYDTTGMLVAGEYSDRLDNRGDVIVLRGPMGEAILDFEYDDAWHVETDGTGPSLVITDASLDPAAWAQPSSWRPSDFPFGSPGLSESEDPGPQGWQIPGDLNQDGQLDLSDPVALLGHLFLGAWPVLPCGEGSLRDPANRELLDVQGDGGVAISDAIYALNYLFLGGTPPSLGSECRPIPGCPDVCR